MGSKAYDTTIDMWSVGCIFGEMLIREPIFPASSELMQLELIYKLCGTPTGDTDAFLSELPNWNSMNIETHYQNTMNRRFKEY